jgi:hypothetical protein
LADISSFLLSWWYTTDTKLAIKFQTLAAKSSGFLNSLNGLSASVDENYLLRNTITSHPVESGVNISDNIIIQPKVISITGLLTAIDTIPIVGTGILNFNQLGSAIQFLFDASDSKTLFTLSTGLYFGRAYFKIKNMAISSINIPRNSQYGRTSIKFNIVFQEMVITDTAPKITNLSCQAALDSNIVGII